MPSMLLRSVRLIPALVAVLLLGACSDDGVIGEEPLVRGTPTVGPSDPDATPSTSPSDQGETYRRIPARVRSTFFPRPAPDLRSWEAGFAVTDNGTTVERPAFPCRRGALGLDVDSSTLAYAETVRAEGDFLISQQLTVYPVGSRAAQFASDLEQEPHVCSREEGKTLVGARSTDFGEDRSFEVKDRSAVFSESVVLRSAEPETHLIDVVSVRGNAVVWTRIVSDRRVRDTIVTAKKRNPEWVDMVRRQSNRGVRALAALTPAQR